MFRGETVGNIETLAEKWKIPYFQEKLKSITFNKVGLIALKYISINFYYTAIMGRNFIGKMKYYSLSLVFYYDENSIQKPYSFYIKSYLSLVIPLFQKKMGVCRKIKTNV